MPSPAIHLLERAYLDAVKFWLPRKDREDILAELADDLHSEIQEAEGRLGRPLDEDELADLLRRRGSPMEVAARYLSGGERKGPMWLLLQRFTTKLVLLWILVPLFVLIAGPGIVFSPNPLAALGWTLLRFVQAAVFGIGMITLVFALLDRYSHRSPASAEWDPRKLRRPRDKDAISRLVSLGEIVWGALFVAWWLDAVRLPAFRSAKGDELTIAFAPDWNVFYWPIAIYAACGIALSVANLMRARWTPLRASIRLLLDLALGGLFGCILWANPGIDVNAPGLATKDALAISNALHTGLRVTLWCGIAVVALIVALQDLPRLLRRREDTFPVTVPARSP